MYVHRQTLITLGFLITVAATPLLGQSGGDRPVTETGAVNEPVVQSPAIRRIFDEPPPLRPTQAVNAGANGVAETWTTSIQSGPARVAPLSLARSQAAAAPSEERGIRSPQPDIQGPPISQSESGDLASVTAALDRLHQKIQQPGTLETVAATPPPVVSSPTQSTQYEVDQPAAGGIEPTGASVAQPIQLQTLMSRLGVNLALVIGLGVLAIFCLYLSRRKTGSVPASRSGAEGSSFNIVTRLSLGLKNQLLLVQIANQRLVVATDAAGIRSVVPIQDSFEGFLDSSDQMERLETRGAAPEHEMDSVGGRYSLGSVGRKRSTGTEGATPPDDRAAALQRQMEQAMSKLGLKEFIQAQTQTTP